MTLIECMLDKLAVGFAESARCYSHSHSFHQRLGDFVVSVCLIRTLFSESVTRAVTSAAFPTCLLLQITLDTARVTASPYINFFTTAPCSNSVPDLGRVIAVPSQRAERLITFCSIPESNAAERASGVAMRYNRCSLKPQAISSDEPRFRAGHVSSRISTCSKVTSGEQRVIYQRFSSLFVRN
jgi:hypothetical protein